MRQIIDDVLKFVQVGKVGSTLRPALSLMGQLELRVICINLLEWWGRGTLMRSSHPYMPISPSYPWCQRFSAMVQVSPELQEFVELDEYACRFAPGVARDEWQRINDYVREHYHPPLFTTRRWSQRG